MVSTLVGHRHAAVLVVTICTGLPGKVAFAARLLGLGGALFCYTCPQPWGHAAKGRGSATWGGVGTGPNLCFDFTETCEVLPFLSQPQTGAF